MMCSSDSVKQGADSPEPDAELDGDPLSDEDILELNSFKESGHQHGWRNLQISHSTRPKKKGVLRVMTLADAALVIRIGSFPCGRGLTPCSRGCSELKVALMNATLSEC